MKNNKGNVVVIIVIILVAIIFSAIIAGSQYTASQNNTTVDEKTNILEIPEIRFEENNIELELNDFKTLSLKVSPTNSDISNLIYTSTNSKIATIKKDFINDDNTILVKIQAVSEGECEVFATYNDIESNRIKVKVIDTERIERERKEAEEAAKKQAEEEARRQAEETARKQAEEAARRQAEEAARKQAEEAARRQAEEAARKQAEEAAKKQQQNKTTKPTTTTTQKNNSNSQTNSNNSHGKTVYRTPSGKRYHFDPDCGGKNSYQTTLDSAKSSGLTPCQKCAK